MGGVGFDRNRFRGGRFHSVSFGGGIFGSFESFGRRRIEDAVGQRPERSLQWRQDLLSRFATAVEGINLRLDLRAEFIGRAPELVQEARDLTADLRHFLRAEKDQRQKKQKDHLAGKAEIHAPIIMRDGGSGPLAKMDETNNLQIGDRRGVSTEPAKTRGHRPQV